MNALRLLLLTAVLVMAVLSPAKETALDAARQEPVAKAASGGSGLPILPLLAAVLGLGAIVKLGGPKLLAFAGSRVHTGVGSGITIVETANVAQGALYVIQVRGKTLLVGATSGAVATLADLTESSQAQVAEPAFFEHFDAALVEAPATEAAEEDTPLNRLNRLMGSVK